MKSTKTCRTPYGVYTLAELDADIEVTSKDLDDYYIMIGSDLVRIIQEYTFAADKEKKLSCLKRARVGLADELKREEENKDE